MSVFVVITGSEKQDVLYPDVIGPFESEHAASDWIDNHPNSHPSGYFEPDHCGYASATIVSANTAQTVEDWSAKNEWRFEDE